MTRIDPAQERQRLAEVYAEQSDGELEQVASQMPDLTDVARDALKAELAKRGLQADDPTERPDQDAPEFRNLVVIRSYWNLLDAEIARGLLDSAGIQAFLFDENMIRMDWFKANALGGIKLRVDAADVEEANRILNEMASDAGESGGPELTPSD